MYGSIVGAARAEPHADIVPGSKARNATNTADRLTTGRVQKEQEVSAARCYIGAGKLFTLQANSQRVRCDSN